MATSPYISIIFVNYQSVWPLSLSLRSLFALELDNDLFEVIVVNNDTEESLALRKLAEQLPFRLVESGTNVGFGQGANIAAALAQGSVLGLLNPDTLWQEASLARVKSFFSGRETPAILGYTLVDAEKEEERFSFGAAPSLSSLFWNNIVPQIFRKHFQSTEEIDWVSGCGLFIPKDLFLTLQGFDEDFFLYFEDVDLCLRAKEHGTTIIRDPQLTLVHSGGKSFSSHASQKDSFYRSQCSYFKKHRSPFEFACLRFFHRLLQAL